MIIIIKLYMQNESLDDDIEDGIYNSYGSSAW